MPGPIHGVLTAGSSHIHLRVDGGWGGGRTGEAGEAKDSVDLPPPPFPALLLKNKTKPQIKSKLKIAVKEILK